MKSAWLIAVLLALTSPLHAQSAPVLYAQVTFRNGALFVSRKADTVIVEASSMVSSPRGVKVFLWPIGARALSTMIERTLQGFPDTLLPGDSAKLPADTVESRFAYKTGATTVRCARPLGCWAVFTDKGRGGYWRPAPNLSARQLILVAAALDRAGSGATPPNPYLLNLRDTLPPAPVASLILTPDSAILAKGDTLRLTVAVRDAAGKFLFGRAITQVSTNPGVATVAGWLVTGVGPGTTSIVATSEGRADTVRVTVPNQAPVAAFTYTCTAARLCTFDGRTSTDDGTITGWRWTGSTGVVWGTTPTISRQFTNAGSGTLTLTVTDNGGRTATVARLVTVP
jgi:hypothetical protein